MRAPTFVTALASLGLAAHNGTAPPATALPPGLIEARGVCEIVPDRASCWDMAGKPSPEITDAIRAALANGGDVSFRLGKKNRYLVVRRPQSLGVNYRTGANDFVYANLSTPGERQTDFLRISTEPSASALTLRAQVTVVADHDVDVPLREGTRATIEGATLEIGAVQKVAEKRGTPSPDPRRYSGPGSNLPSNVERWTIVLGLTGRVDNGYGWGYTPLDAAGSPIRYVDAEGRPISAIRALALEPTLQPNNYNPYPGNGENAGATRPKAMGAVFQAQSTTPAFRVTTNIDPARIAILRVRASHVETTDVGPFPLDPR